MHDAASPLAAAAQPAAAATLDIFTDERERFVIRCRTAALRAGLGLSRAQDYASAKLQLRDGATAFLPELFREVDASITAELPAAERGATVEADGGSDGGSVLGASGDATSTDRRAKQVKHLPCRTNRGAINDWVGRFGRRNDPYETQRIKRHVPHRPEDCNGFAYSVDLKTFIASDSPNVEALQPRSAGPTVRRLVGQVPWEIPAAMLKEFFKRIVGVSLVAVHEPKQFLNPKQTVHPGYRFVTLLDADVDRAMAFNQRCIFHGDYVVKVWKTSQAAAEWINVTATDPRLTPKDRKQRPKAVSLEVPRERTTPATAGTRGGAEDSAAVAASKVTATPTDVSSDTADASP